MTQNKFPKGWDAKRVGKVLAHYETQSMADAVAEDEAAVNVKRRAVMEVPLSLVPAVRRLIAKHQMAVPIKASKVRTRRAS